MSETIPSQNNEISNELAITEKGDLQEQRAVEELSKDQRRVLVIVVVIAILLFLLIALILIYLLNQPPVKVAHIRDVFIIFLALQSILTGFVLVILMIQLARLTNLLQNEIKPILDSTNETVSNLRGTTTFLSNNLTEPVIKLNEYLAGFSQFFSAIGFRKKR